MTNMGRTIALMIGIQDIYAAGQRIRPYLHQTPVFTSKALDRLSNHTLFFKGEHLQKTGSFKARGALNAALQLQQPTGLLAVSSGNHAQGVAYAASVLGVEALIVMPLDASPLKKAATLGYGAIVHDQGVYVENREVVAQELAQQTGYAFIHPFNDEQVMAGQGTVGLELLAQIPRIEAVLVPVGGGGLISGTATAMKGLAPWVEVIGVEPEVADDARRSLAEGYCVQLPSAPDTVADGVRTLALGERTFEVIKARVDRIVTVSEAAVLEAQSLLFTRSKQVVEPTGALTLAAVLSGYELPERLGLVVSGGNATLPGLSSSA